MTKDPIERLREELTRPPLFNERNGYETLDRAPLLGLLEEVEAQYMRLPVDGDGVPIRPGDLIESEYMHKPMTVADVGRFDVYAYDERERGFFIAKACRHVNHDTVEDVLVELSDAAMAMHSVGFMPIGEIRKYAERIRKAVEHG